MNYTIEMLITGDKAVVEYYKKAKQKWAEIIKDNPTFNPEKFAKELSHHQLWFEHNCGGRWEGQEIMVVVGIGQFYTTMSGFEGENLKRALAVYDGFRRSFCSIEVKGCAEDVAANYSLLER